MKQIILMTTFVIIGLMSIGATKAAFAQMHIPLPTISEKLEAQLHVTGQIPSTIHHHEVIIHIPHEAPDHFGIDVDVDVKQPR